MSIQLHDVTSHNKIILFVALSARKVIEICNEEARDSMHLPVPTASHHKLEKLIILTNINKMHFFPPPHVSFLYFTELCITFCIPQTLME